MSTSSSAPLARRVTTPAQAARAQCEAIERATASVPGVVSAQAIRLLTPSPAFAQAPKFADASERMRVDVVINGAVPIPDLARRIRERIAQERSGPLDLVFSDVVEPDDTVPAHGRTQGQELEVGR